MSKRKRTTKSCKTLVLNADELPKETRDAIVQKHWDDMPMEAKMKFGSMQMLDMLNPNWQAEAKERKAREKPDLIAKIKKARQEEQEHRKQIEEAAAVIRQKKLEECEPKFISAIEQWMDKPDRGISACVPYEGPVSKTAVEEILKRNGMQGLFTVEQVTNNSVELTITV